MITPCPRYFACPNKNKNARCDLGYYSTYCINCITFYRRQFGVCLVFSNTYCIGRYDYLSDCKNHTYQIVLVSSTELNLSPS